MEPYLSTTSFGRRMFSLAHVASQAIAKARLPEKGAHKWQIFRAICMAKARIGVSERALAVLDALLSFHPETVLSGEELIVFPSNQQLALRAHGMAPATLRRHLAALVECGLIIRRDSPNGKRYARKGQGGDITLAFGFDLGPLVARAEEFEAWATDVRNEERAVKLVRERITICRRDIAKMIATGLEGNVPITGRDGAGWPEIHAIYRSILARLPRSATRLELEPIAKDLSLLADEVLRVLENHLKTQNPSGTESQTERHIQNSNTDNLIKLEPPREQNRAPASEPTIHKSKGASAPFPLSMTMDACPNLADYSRGPIANWRDFIATTVVVRPMLGVSLGAWEEARTVMGEISAAITVAAILQRGDAINNAGGYLRGLTEKARAGEFSVGPMLMALIGKRKREKKRA